MGIKIDTQKVLLWDYEQYCMVTKTEVYVRIVTNKGTVLMEEGPLYCLNGKEIFEATRILYERMISSLPGIKRDNFISHNNIV